MLALRIEPEAGYTFYAHTNSEVGLPLAIHTEKIQKGLTAYFPAGVRKPDLYDPAKMAQVHDGPTTIPIIVDSGALQQVTLSVSLLLCSEKNCQPVTKQLNAKWDHTSLPTTLEESWWPTPATYTAVALTSATAAAPSPPSATALSESLGVELPGTVNPAQLKQLGTSSESTSVTTPSRVVPLPAGTASPVPHVQAEKAEQKYAFTPRYFLQALEVTSLGNALLLGLIAGLILNIMPCVLPVISLKLSAFLSSAQEADQAKRTALFREHNLFFALGILVWFSCLAAILTAAGLAWGQLFQNEWVLVFLTTLVFGLGLSAFNVFHLPMVAFSSGAGSFRSSRREAFFTGLLATLLATPCSGPFLGGVLGWAFLQPPLILAITFMAIGFGMATPYLLLAAFPKLSRFLPKAGAWTNMLSTLIGFFLMGTAAYLLSLLPAAKLPAMLILLWTVAVCAWIFGRFANLQASTMKRRLIGGLCLLFIILAARGAVTTVRIDAEWTSFEKGMFLQQLGHQPMVLDFTADWCPSCKVLEHTVLTPKNRAQWTRKYGVQFISVDMTAHNPDKQALLAALGSSSIPLVAFFPAGSQANTPLVLRDLFTTTQAEQALEEAFN